MQNDQECPTGCGCRECGPARLDADGDPFDAELERLRSKLSRIGELVEKWATSDPYQPTATLNAIREELSRG